MPAYLFLLKILLYWADMYLKTKIFSLYALRQTRLFPCICFSSVFCSTVQFRSGRGQQNAYC